MKQAVMALSSAAQPNRRALWIPGIFVLGFLIVIAVNGILIFTAISSFSGLETDSAYDKGLHYNQALAGAAANARTGWRAEPRVTAKTGMDRKLEIMVTDRDGKPVIGLMIEAHLVRPTNAGMDIALKLTDFGAGRYGATFAPEALGNWDLRLKASRGDIAWQQAQRIFLR